VDRAAGAAERGLIQMHFALGGKRVFVAGHRGMVGRALCQRLSQEDCIVLSAERSELDLMRQTDVERWFAAHRPDAVFVAAAKVGGIMANINQPAEFLHNNLMIAANIIAAAQAHSVARLCFIASSSIYPKMAAQPMIESALLTGPLEPSHEGYAIAKIAGIKYCEVYRQQYGADFFAAIPTNLYGTGDNYDAQSSHVLPALVRKFHDAAAGNAQNVTLWGSGTPMREFMHADDCADALVFLMQHYSDAQPINVGSGQEISIRDLANLIAKHAGFNGTITMDADKPDGPARKLMDSSRLWQMGWQPKIPLAAGIARTLREYEQLALRTSGTTEAEVH
jgi:GDP-L-fucose synthase